MAVKDIEAYELIKDEELAGIKSRGKLLRHKKSGARVVLIENDDDNKVFNIGFRTPPSDSTGVPHIMEHSVLCGSKNFPAKDPFVELVKGSLNTFLNAMTYPDKTMYPVASCNDQDFQNLMHVYMDAVFYPNIYVHDEIFRQEGWSYKLDSPDAPLGVSGVVYNEMKGAFSSPDGVLDRYILNSLFPDTSYANESGGDPADIPNLTYEAFLDFHRKYYHPCNSYIYLYGKMDMEEKLRWLDQEYLQHFEKIEVDSELKLQEPFEQMREYVIPYSIASEESEEDNTFLSYTKAFGTVLDTKLCAAFEVLDYALLSSPGAPIKKALIESGIGDDVDGGFDDGIYQPTFSVVVKSANLEQKEEFVAIIEGVIKDAIANGIDTKSIEAGINYSEFRYREADFGSYPKGLMYGLNLMGSWLYDENRPFDHIELLDTFEFLKSQIGTGYYEELLQKYLIDNQHGVIVSVVPEPGRAARLDEEFAAKLQAYKESLSEEEINRLVERTHQLTEYQEEEEDPQVLEKIPVLARSDLRRGVEPIVNEEMTIGGQPAIFHEIETNGIGYLDLMFEIKGIREDMLPYVGILQSVLGIIDTENYDYGAFTNEVNVHTGGIGTSLELYSDVKRMKEKAFTATFEVHTKALYDKMDVAILMVKEMLTRSKLGDTKRLKEIISTVKSRMTMRFQSSGHSVALLRAMSYDQPASRFKDLTANVAFYQVIKELDEHFEEKKDEIVQNLEELCKKLFRADNMLISYTAAREGLDGMDEKIMDLSASLFTEPVIEEEMILSCEKRNEAFKTASQVQYVCRAGNFRDNGETYNGALSILKTILGYEYLWQNVRVKNGAYGCMCGFSRIGDSYFVSYRDPKLKKTLDIYEGVVDFVKNFTVSERDMTKYIIGTMSGIDTPMTPNGKGSRSMSLYMIHVDEELLQKERDQILDADQDDIRALAPIIEAMLKSDNICVVGGEGKIERFKDLFMNVTSF